MAKADRAQVLIGNNGYVERKPTSSLLDGGDQAVVAKYRWVNAQRQLAYVSEKLVGIALEVGQILVAKLSATEDVACQPQVCDQRNDLLLHTVVNVPLDAASFGVLRRDDSGPGPGQYLKAFGQLTGESGVGDGGGRLGG